MGLARLQQRLVVASEAPEIADAALALCREALGAAAATFQSAAVGGALAAVRSAGVPDRFVAALTEAGGSDGWPLDHVAPRRLAIPKLDTDEGRLALGRFWQPLHEAGFAAAVVEPLVLDGHVLGVLAAYWDEPRTLSTDDGLLLEIAGGQLALALDRLAAQPTTDEVMQGRLVAIVESSEDAIVGKDLDGVITNWNSGAQRLYGYTQDEVIGRPIALLVPENRPDELPSIMARLRRGERIEQLETQRVRKDGTLLDVSVSISPILDQWGRVVGAASIARDITARRQAAREHAQLLVRERAARERAERAVNRLSRLQRVTETLAGAMTMEEIARAVIEGGVPGVDAAAGSVRLLSEDGRSLDLIAASGFPESLIRQVRRISVDSASPIAVAFRTGAPAWREVGGESDPRFADFMRRAPTYPSGAALPLVADGRIIGGIGLSFQQPRSFSDEEKGFMLALAGQCAQAALRVRLYEQERAAREQLDTILGGIADGVVVQREDGTFIYANDAAARLAGFASADEYLGEQAITMSRNLSVVDVEGRPFPLDQLPARRAFRGEHAPEMIVQFRRADTNTLRSSRTQARIIRGPTGERLAISIFHDMTDELRSRDRLRFLADAGAQLTGSLDIDATLSALVRVACGTLADWAVVILVTEDGTVEHIASNHRDPEKAALIANLHDRQLKHASGAKLLWQTIQTGEPTLIPEVTDEMIVQNARNPEHLAALRVLGLTSLLYVPLSGRGRVQGALALFMTDPLRQFGEEDRAIAMEIARRASLVLENARLYQQANAAVQARDEFLSIASHELRTPVTAIFGVAQVLLRARQRGTLDEARLMRSLEQIMRGSQRLVTLTEDLLDVSRLQTRRFELRQEPMDVTAFVTEFVERFSTNLDERHQLRLVTDGPGRIFQVDPARFEQVLANLLANAVKYTPDGGDIEVTVRHAPEPADAGGDGSERNGIRISVRDSGIGLPTGSEEAIFHPFGRAPNAMHRQIQGLGLGLYICRQILERHGGRIWASSAGDGYGTTFTLWLPEPA